MIVFSHNDLDALGCLLNIEYKLPNVPKKYFHTNYADIAPVVAEIIQYARKNNETHIIVTDVSFSDSVDSMRLLYESGLKITYIDHHLYPDGFFEQFPDMNVVWDKSKCASLLCNEAFGNTGKNENLDKLTRLIDVYDIWQTDEVEFDVTQDINEYFWSKIRASKYTIEQLMNEIIDNDWKLPKDYVELTTSIKELYTREIASFYERDMIKTAGDITLCFVNDWFNQILISEMKKGVNFVIGFTSYGIVRVRIREGSPYSSDMKNKLRLLLTGTENTGHMNAFTYKCDTDKLLEEAQKIVNAINS